MFANSSSEDSISWYAKGSRLQSILFASFYIVVFLIAVPGNTMALWVFCRQEKTSPSKIFLSNLSVADISYVLVLPMRIIYHLKDSHWPFGEITCRLVGYLFYLNMYCSLYFMSWISLDRFMALVLPLKTLALRQRTFYARIGCFLLWLVIILLMSPLLLSKQTMQVDDGNRTVCCQLYREKVSDKALVASTVAFAIPLVTVMASYTLILQRLWSMRRQGENHKREKSIRMILLILLNFLVAFVPYHANRFIYIVNLNHRNVSSGEMVSLTLTNRITSSLTCISVVLDPVMYFFLVKSYQRTLNQLFCRLIDRDHQSSTI